MGVIIIDENGDVEYDSYKKPEEDKDDRDRMPFPSGYVEPALVPVSSEIPAKDEGGWHPGLGDINDIIPR